MHVRNAAIALGIVALGVGAGAAQEEGPARATIQVAAVAEVDADGVCLGDVAQVLDASSEAYAAALRGVFVAPAPLPGLQRSVSLGFIRRYVVGRRDLHGQLTWTGEQACRVVRKTPALPPQQPPRPEVPANAEGAGPAGEAAPEGTPTATTAVPALRGLVAARDLVRGDVIAASDVVLTDMPDATGPVFGSAEEAVGLRLRQAVRAGAVLRPDATERVPDIARGAPVTLVVERGALRVSAQGVAEKAGFVGDVIPVQLLVEGPRRVVQAEVVGAGTVRLP